MIAALVLLVILLVLSPLASQIPAAVLAGILVTVGIGVMDYKGLNALSKIPRTEVIIMAVVLFLSVFLESGLCGRNRFGSRFFILYEKDGRSR